MQKTFKDVIAAEIEEAIAIAEDNIAHDIREAYMEAHTAKRKMADLILMQIRTIYDINDDDAELDIFAKVLQLETVLGLC